MENGNDKSTTDESDKIIKKAMSPSPPVLLISPTPCYGKEDDNSGSSGSADGGGGGGSSGISDKSLQSQEDYVKNISKSFEKQLALIETNDINELNMVLSTIRGKFPNVNIHLCFNNISHKDKESLLNKIKSCNTVENEYRHQAPNLLKATNSPDLHNNNFIRNSLSANFYDRKCSDRAASIDNSSLSLNTSIERQESKDSGIWSKCSFESMKSLSISDTHHPNDAGSVAAAIAAATASVFKTHLNENELKNISVGGTSPSTSSNTSASPKCASSNENDSSSRRFLTSPTNMSKSPLYNWKKWKKTQTWRYNSSSSNLSQSDSNNNSSMNEMMNNSLNPNYSNPYASNGSSGSNSFDSSILINRSMDNSMSPFKNSERIDDDEYQDENNVSNKSNNLSQTHAVSHFSNSFESSCTSTVHTLIPSNLHLWSSTSKLEAISNNNNSNNYKKIQSSTSSSMIETNQQLKGQKRRGKLVRDRTIDNPDEQTSSFNNLSHSNGSTKTSNSNIDASGKEGLVNEAPTVTDSQPNDHLNSSNSSSPKQVGIFGLQTGRISPPEKRVSLSFKHGLSASCDEQSSPSGSCYLNEYSQQEKAPFQTQNSLNFIVSHLLSNTYLNHQNELLKHQQHSSSSKNLDSSASTSPSPSSVSSCTTVLANNNQPRSVISPQSVGSPASMHEVAMNSAAAAAAAAIAAAVASSSPGVSASPSSTVDPKSHNAYDSFSINQYEFYKDLQSKLKIKANEQEENNTNSASSSPYLSSKLKSCTFTNQSNFTNNLIPNQVLGSMNNNNLSAFTVDYLGKKNLNPVGSCTNLLNTDSITPTNTITTTNINLSSSPRRNEQFQIQQQQQPMNTHLSTMEKHFNNTTFDTVNKIVSRSSSSPSYSSISQSSSSISPASANMTIQYHAHNNSLNNSSINLDQNKLNIFSPIQSGFSSYNKSSSCSLPISPYQHQQNMISNVNPFTTSSITQAMAVAAAAAAANNSNKSDTSNNSNRQQNLQTKFENVNRHLLNTKPPEIVITESKSDNDQIDYENDNDLNYKNNYMKKLDNFQIKQENMFVNYLYPREPSLMRPSSNDPDNYTNNNNSGCGSPKSKPKNKPLNENEYFKTIPSLENIFKKTNENPFDIWKASNPVLNLTPGITNGLSSNGNNSNSVSNLMTNQLNKSASSASSASSSKIVKPHVCGNCQKRFARSDMLIRHSRLHSGVRPYRCNRCGQEFSRSDHLNTHLRTHTGEKPYSCPHPKCTYAACRKDMITRHLKVHTKNRLSLSFESEKLPTSNKLNAYQSLSFDYSNNSNKNPVTNTGLSNENMNLQTNSVENQDLKNSMELFNQSKS